MKALLQLALRAREELAANPRLRLGVWVIAAILLFYWVAIVQPERRALAVDEYADTASRLASSERVMARRDEWPGLRAAAEESDQALQRSFWRADTEGLARAGLQETLEKIVADLDVRNVAIESGASRPVPEVEGLWQVQARLTANYSAGTELKLLHALATHPSKLVVDRMDLVRGRQPRVFLIVSAHFVDLSPDA